MKFVHINQVGHLKEHKKAPSRPHWLCLINTLSFSGPKLNADSEHTGGYVVHLKYGKYLDADNSSNIGPRTTVYGSFNCIFYDLQYSPKKFSKTFMHLLIWESVITF